MSEWIDCELQDVAKVQVSNVDKKSYAGQKIIALCNYMDVYSNHYITPEIDFMVSTASAEEIEKFKVKCGDVIITKDSETPFDIGISAAVTAEIDDLICGYHLAQLRPQPDKINSIFLAKTLSSDRSKKYFAAHSAGSTRYGLSNRSIQRVPLSLPSLNHQKKIAAILETVDLAIEQTEALIAKYEQVKAGMMQDLFTRGLTPEGKLRPTRQQAPNQYQKTPIGWIPKEWEVKALQECCDELITYGIVQAGPHIEDGVPYIRTGDMSGEYLEIDDMLRTSFLIASSYQRSEVKTGDIVCAIRATVGKVLPVPPELDGANLTQGTAKLSPNSETVQDFLLWLMRTEQVKRQIDLTIKGTTFSEITLADLRLLRVGFPKKFTEQLEIAERMNAVSQKVVSLTADSEKLRQQKSGLMHDLLTGKVAVKV